MINRFHPLSPVLKGLRLLGLAIAFISWRGLQELGITGWLIAVGGLTVLLLAYSAVAWRFSGYQMVGRELRIHEGVLFRKVRAVPLERLQSIEVVQPALARVFGLAELKLDVAGSGKAEAPLSFLQLPEAVRLRKELLVLHSGQAVSADTAEQPEAPEALIHQVRDRDVVLSQVLTPPVLLAPFAVIYIVTNLIFREEHSFFSIASMITAVGATIGAPILRMLNFWRFRLGRTEDGRLRLRHGLVEKVSQVVPVHRIQTLTLTWPLLWRPQHWLRATLVVAGQPRAEEGRRKETDRLLPVATIEVARQVVPLALSGVDILHLPLSPVPASARWLAPIRAGILTAGLTDQAFGAVDGLLTRELTLVPYGRIQSVRLVQGPLQRRLGLATVLVDVAGGSPVTAQHRPVAEAHAWLEQLSERARLARAASAAVAPLPRTPASASPAPAAPASGDAAVPSVGSAGTEAD